MGTGQAYDACDHRFPLFASGVRATGALEIAVPGIVDLLPMLVAAALARAVPVMDASARGVPVTNVPVTSVPEKDAAGYPYYSAGSIEPRLEVELRANV